MEIAFTPAGAVPAPDTLQIRVDPDFPGRVPAGAASPSRALADAEVAEAVRRFTRGGPRARAVTRLVLSGVPTQRLAGLATVVAEARALGVTHVTLHLAAGTPPGAVPADSVVARLRHDDDPAWLAAFPGVHRVGVLVLDASFAAPPRRPSDGIDRVVGSWPFPPEGPPLAADRLGAALDAIAAWRGQGAWSLAGIPPCVAGRHGVRSTRARNRWYVDADHPASEPLMFFPDVVRYAKLDACRFCAADARCDGVARAWLDAGPGVPLAPLRDDSA